MVGTEGCHWSARASPQATALPDSGTALQQPSRVLAQGGVAARPRSPPSPAGHCSTNVEQKGLSFLFVATFASWKLVCDPATNCQLSSRVKAVASCSLRTVPVTSVHHPQRLFLLRILSERFSSLYVMNCVVFNVWAFHYLSSECFHWKKNI